MGKKLKDEKRRVMFTCLVLPSTLKAIKDRGEELDSQGKAVDEMVQLWLAGHSFGLDAVRAPKFGSASEKVKVADDFDEPLTFTPEVEQLAQSHGPARMERLESAGNTITRAREAAESHRKNLRSLRPKGDGKR